MKDDNGLVPDLFEGLLAAATTGGWGALPVALRRLWPAVTREWEQNSSRCVKAAVHASGMSREDLQEAILLNPSAVNLTVRALHYAGMNGADEALLTMGAAVGSALNGEIDTSCEDAALIVEAAKNLSQRHVEVMRLLSAKRVDEQGERITTDVSHLPEEMGIAPIKAEMLVASCTAAGTVSVFSGFGALVYETSALGEEVLQLLETLGDHFE